MRTAWRVIERHRDTGAPGVHASAHRGSRRGADGDYFGTVVHVAARILAAARRDQLVATSAVAHAADRDLAWQDAGTGYVRGVKGTVELCQLVGPRS